MWKKKYKKIIFDSEFNTKEELNENLLEAKKLKYENIPKKLYKYYPVREYSLKNFENDTVYLNKPKNFNDIFECECEIDSCNRAEKEFEELLKEMKSEFERIEQSNSPLDKEAAEFIFDPNFKKLMDKFKEGKKKKLDDLKIALKESCLITCFSERFSDQKMWSGYAENFKGFCLEYNFGDLLIDDLRSLFLFPVIYDDDKPDITNFNLSLFPSLLGYYISMFKGSDWEHEKEWRIIFNNIFESAQTIKLPEPVCIYLGPEINIEDKKKLIKIAQNKGMNIFQMEKRGGLLKEKDLIDEIFEETLSEMYNQN